MENPFLCKTFIGTGFAGDQLKTLGLGEKKMQRDSGMTFVELIVVM